MLSFCSSTSMPRSGTPRVLGGTRQCPSRFLVRVRAWLEQAAEESARSGQEARAPQLEGSNAGVARGHPDFACELAVGVGGGAVFLVIQDAHARLGRLFERHVLGDLGFEY